MDYIYPGIILVEMKLCFWLDDAGFIGCTIINGERHAWLSHIQELINLECWHLAYNTV